jgi:phage protein D
VSLPSTASSSASRGVADVPDYDITLAGGRMPAGARRDIRSITVQEDVDALSMFTIELYNWDEAKRKVTWSDAPTFAVGIDVVVSLGYLGDLRPVMTGEITSLEPTFAAGRTPLLVVRGYDHRVRLSRKRGSDDYRKVKISDLASTIAAKAGLGAQVEDSGVTHESVARYNQTDLEFLRSWAKRIGFEVFVKDKVLHFAKPTNTRKAAVTLVLDVDVTEFTPRLSALPQVGEVTVRGWDVKQKKAIVGRARAGQEAKAAGDRSSGPQAADRALGAGTAATLNLPVDSQAEADQFALGQLDEMALQYIQGDVGCYGRPQVRAGVVVEVAGAGTTFSGPYYVTSAVHSMTPDGYTTQLSVRRNAT